MKADLLTLTWVLSLAAFACSDGEVETSELSDDGIASANPGEDVAATPAVDPDDEVVSTPASPEPTEMMPSSDPAEAEPGIPAEPEPEPPAMEEPGMEEPGMEDPATDPPMEAAPIDDNHPLVGDWLTQPSCQIGDTCLVNVLSLRGDGTYVVYAMFTPASAPVPNSLPEQGATAARRGTWTTEALSGPGVYPVKLQATTTEVRVRGTAQEANQASDAMDCGVGNWQAGVSHFVPGAQVDAACEQWVVDDEFPNLAGTERDISAIVVADIDVTSPVEPILVDLFRNASLILTTDDHWLPVRASEGFNRLGEEGSDPSGLPF